MRSSVSVSAGAFRIALGEFMSGPKLREEIELFVTHRSNYCAYEPNFDSDLPSRKMALYLNRVKDRIQIEMRDEYYCSCLAYSTWMPELNDSLRACSQLGVHYISHTEKLDDLILINSSFKVQVPEEGAIRFLNVLCSELDSRTSG
jgi:hypothetical protein